jgi:hypothetical protein
MNNDASTMLLFADNDQAAARMAAVDAVHNATAIYTAEPVVMNLLNQVNWPNGDARLVDPSAGDGMFLGCALTKALSAHAFDDEDLPSVIEGWEIHPHACAQARARIEAILVAHGRPAAFANELAAKIVHNRDFLTDGPEAPTWDVIAGNPPYLRWVNVPDLLKDLYASCVPKYASRDMLHSFLDRCARTLRPGGEIALVTSDRWLFNDGAGELREKLGERLAIRHLERLDVTTAFYRPKQRRAGTPPRIHPISVVLSSEGAMAMTKAPIYPDATPGRYAGMPTLGEIAEVRLAPRMGPHGIFVMTADEARAADIPMEWLVPAIDTDDICDGLLGMPTRYVLRTKRNEIPCAEVLAHLERTIHRMPKQSRRKTLWLPPESFAKFDLTRPSLLIPRIARTKTTRAIRVPAGILPIEHNLSIVAGDDATLNRVEAAIATDLAQQWIQEHAARLEGGFVSLTTTHLRNLPISL